MRCDALAAAVLLPLAEEERRAGDRQTRVSHRGNVTLDFAFHPVVEDPRPGIRTVRTHEQVLRRSGRAPESGGENREVVIDEAELFLRSRDLDRGAEGAEDGVDGEEGGVVFHPREIDRMLLELRVADARRAARHDDHAGSRLLGQQLLQQLASDQAGRAQQKMHSIPHLFGMLPEDLAEHLRGAGVAVRDAEARRIVAHAIAHGRAGHPVSRPVPRSVEQAVDALVDRRRLEILERATDPSDGFVKYLFRLHDGAFVEAVRIPLEVEGRFTVCLSSQAGCAMGCDFCATGRLGLTRNLEPWEIVAQFVAVRDEAPGPVTGAVFQGQGEPLHNYANVIRAAEILTHPCGGRVSAKAVTISTVGLVPAIHRYASEGHPYRLIVSLTSAIDERRRSLLPAASAWSVRELADAVRAYQRAAGGRVTIAWVVMGGVNTGTDEVDALRELFDGVPLRINLIDVNVPSEEVHLSTTGGPSTVHPSTDLRNEDRKDARLRSGSPQDAEPRSAVRPIATPRTYRRATDTELASLRDALRTLGVPVVRRYSGGAAKHAACGMLAAMRG